MKCFDKRHLTWFDPVSGRSPGEGNGNPLQCSCLENSIDRGAWQTTVHGAARVGHDLATKQQFIKDFLSSGVQWIFCNKASLAGGGACPSFLAVVLKHHECTDAHGGTQWTCGALGPLPSHIPSPALGSGAGTSHLSLSQTPVLKMLGGSEDPTDVYISVCVCIYNV